MFSWFLYCYSGFCNAFCVEFRNVHPYLPPMPMSPSASITRNLSLTVFAFFDIPFPPRGRLLGPDVGGSATETGVAAPDGFALASSKCPSPVNGVSNLVSDLVQPPLTFMVHIVQAHLTALSLQNPRTTLFALLTLRFVLGRFLRSFLFFLLDESSLVVICQPHGNVFGAVVTVSRIEVDSSTCSTGDDHFLHLFFLECPLSNPFLNRSARDHTVNCDLLCLT